jgi:hypothetical protein
MPLSIDRLHIGMKVLHPGHGLGIVKALTEHTADISFDDAVRTVAPTQSELESADPTATMSELQMPLSSLISEIAQATVDSLGLEKPEAIVEGIAQRWEGGRLVIEPADKTLQSKDVPLDIFFHKIVMIRNNLRVLEQKVNASEKLTEAEKFDMQQYITRCYGSLTTFNILFKNKEDQFTTK